MLTKFKKGDRVRLPGSNWVHEDCGTNSDTIFTICNIIEDITYVYDEEDNETEEIDFVDYDISLRYENEESEKCFVDVFNPSVFIRVEERSKEQQLSDKIKQLWERQEYVRLQVQNR